MSKASGSNARAGKPAPSRRGAGVEAPATSRRSGTRPAWPARSRSTGRTTGTSTARSTRRTRPATWPTRTHPRAGAEKLFVLDMFPYPSGAGLHVGHPLGYIGTDCYGRYQRMAGRNVLHAMGFDAFGLPAEQYAVQTGKHPRLTTEANVERYRLQMRRLGLAYDARRSVATTDVEFYRWTQWIFLQIFNSWYDPERARPARSPNWSSCTRRRSGPPRTVGRGRTVRSGASADHRRPPAGLRQRGAGELVPGPGHGAGQRGGHRRRAQRPRQLPGVQAHPEAVDDADHRVRRPPAGGPGHAGLARAGQADAAELDRPVHRRPHRLPGVVPTVRGGRSGCSPRRPDTVFGATYMVLAPEHELVDAMVPAAWPEGTMAAGPAGTRPRPRPSRRTGRSPPETEAERTAEAKEKTGVFVGAFATNPATGPDPGVHRRLRAGRLRHRRDHGGARPGRAGLGVRRGLRPADRAHRAAEGGLRRQGLPGRRPGHQLVQSYTGSLDGLGVAEAKEKIIEWLEREGHGQGAVTFRLRDWLFSRQRYWGEPFPIVYDETGLPIALPDSMLPLELPEVDDFSPKTFDPDDANTSPETPLSRAQGLGRGRAGPGRRPEAVHPRDQHDAAVGRLVLVRAALPGPDQRQVLCGPGERALLDGPAVDGTVAASTCTWAGWSTRSCTCCTPGSGTRCCTTWGT